jgi:uncharacterized protein YndB with AHSA1/START domain
MKWLLIALAVLAGLVLLMALVGLMLPKGHVATRRATFKRPPEELWAALTDVERFPEWRPDLEKVERLSDTRWVETGSYGRMELERVEADPPRRLVGRIAPGLAFGGSWTYELAREGDGTVLSITENGEVYNPIFRFLSRFVFGHTATLEQYLKALGKKFGEDVTARP